MNVMLLFLDPFYEEMKFENARNRVLDIHVYATLKQLSNKFSFFFFQHSKRYMKIVLLGMWNLKILELFFR